MVPVGTGKVDVIIEDWGHPGLERGSTSRTRVTAQPRASARTATRASSGGTCRRGWRESTRTPRTGRTSTNTLPSSKPRSPATRGQFLGVDPSFVTFDKAIINNPGRDFKVIYSGSEAASIGGTEKQRVADRLLLRASVAIC